MSIVTAGLIYVSLLLVIAAYFDVRFYIIPNWISIALIAGFVVMAIASGFGIEAWAWRVGIAVGIFIFGLLLFSMKMMGGGDVKLLAAVSLWLEAPQFLPFIFYMSLFGALIAIVKMIHLAFMMYRRGEKIKGAQLTKSEIPYGLAIAAGAILVLLPHSPLI